MSRKKASRPDLAIHQPRVGEAWRLTCALVEGPFPHLLDLARQATHDTLYDETDGGRLMRRPPGVAWSYHTGVEDITEAASLAAGSSPEQQQALRDLVASLEEYPNAVLVVGRCIARIVDPRLN